MKLGILADIHEHVEELRRAIDVLSRHGSDRFVVLGDVFETGKHIEETVRLLRDAGAVGVWGNHDFGVCCQPDDRTRQRFSPAAKRCSYCLTRFAGCHSGCNSADRS